MGPRAGSPDWVSGDRSGPRRRAGRTFGEAGLGPGWARTGLGSSPAAGATQEEVEQGVSAAVIHRYGLEDVRRFATALGAAVGLTPARSAKLAAHLLWFDAAG